MFSEAKASHAMSSNVRSNADSSARALPAYKQTLEDDRISMKTQDSQQEDSNTNEKRRHTTDSPENRENAPHPSPRFLEHIIPQAQSDDGRSVRNNAILAVDSAPACNLTESATTAKLVGARFCSIFTDQTATWLVKRKSVALSSLAAAVLLREGLMVPQQLELFVTFSMMQAAY